MPPDWFFPCWFAFAVFCNYNGKPDIGLSCLTNSSPSDKKQSPRAAQRKKASREKKKEIEATVLSEDSAFEGKGISFSNWCNIISIAQKEEMLQQYQDGREMCTLQQSFMMATQQLKSAIQVTSALCLSGDEENQHWKRVLEIQICLDDIETTINGLKEKKLGEDSSKSYIAADFLQTFDRQEGSVAKRAKTERKTGVPKSVAPSGGMDVLPVTIDVALGNKEQK
eukprot:7523324-Ditylum_brightwellii.AAC.1